MTASCAFVKWVKLTLKGALLLSCAWRGLASSALLLLSCFDACVFYCCVFVLFIVVFTFQVCQANISRTMCARACLIEHVGGQWWSCVCPTARLPDGRQWLPADRGNHEGLSGMVMVYYAASLSRYKVGEEKKDVRVWPTYNLPA